MPIAISTEVQEKAFRGLFARPATSGLNPVFLREALNCDFRGGVASRRGGLRRINNTALSGTGYGPFYARFQSGINELLAAHGANISVVTREPTAISQSLPTDWVARVGNTTYFNKLNDSVFICNQTDNDTKYGGTNLQKWGISAPSAAPTITESSGTVSSTRRYKTTYLNSTTVHEGPDSSATADITLTNEQASSASPATPTDPQVNQWRLYAAVVSAGRPGVYYRVGTAALGTAIVDNVSDAVLKTAQILEEFTNNPPSGPLRFAVVHQGRILAIPQDDRSIIYISDHDGFFSKPESFPVMNFLPINYRDGDVLTAIVSFDEYFLAIKQFSIWAVIGAWPNVSVKAVSYRPDNTGIGTIDQRAVVAFERGAVFPSHDGVYVIEKGSVASEDLFRTTKISGWIDDFYAQVDLSQNMFAAFDRSRRSYRLWCTLRTGQNQNAPVIT